MRENGYTIVELIVVLTIVAVLLAIATQQFGEMNKKSAIEGQVTSMHADLMNARLQAMYGKRERTVRIIGRQFSSYSSAETSVAPEQTKTLAFPVVWSTGTSITFNSNGLVSGSTGASICIEPVNDLTRSNPASMDSLVISIARINPGKRTVSGGVCDSAHIQQQ